MGAVTDAIRDDVRRELVELAEIQDADLRDKVVEAWALALARDGFGRISDIEGSGAPGYWVLKRGTQLDHIRGSPCLRMAGDTPPGSWLAYLPDGGLSGAHRPYRGGPFA